MNGDFFPYTPKNPDEVSEGPSQASLGMLTALQGKPMYQGTVPDATIAKRRKRNKAAKASRKLNRK